MARNRSSITGFVGDVVDSTKTLVDDLIDRAGNVERDVRNSVGDAVSYDDRAEKPARSATAKS